MFPISNWQLHETTLKLIIFLLSKEKLCHNVILLNISLLINKSLIFMTRITIYTMNVIVTRHKFSELALSN